MKPTTSSRRIEHDNHQATGTTQMAEMSCDFDHILDLIRVVAADVRKNATCVQLHRESLKEKEEPEWRLRELEHWRESAAFTEREKAAMGLSEAISLKQPEDGLMDVLSEGRRHFNVAEMVNLSLSAMAVNDWLDLHSEKRLRVLVVEDNPDDQELLRRQLSRIQMDENVIFAPDASEALDLVAGVDGELFRQQLLAMFLDVQLPGMDGIELLQRIRMMPGMADLPVIVMTSSNDPLDVEECSRLKVVSYVEKPVTLESFSHALANIFHSARKSSNWSHHLVE